VHGLNLLKEGLIWHIGDGKTVCIWRDNWLPRKEELKVLGEKGRSRLIRVSSLIDQGRWDEGLLHRTFPLIDAEAISWPSKMKVMDYFWCKVLTGWDYDYPSSAGPLQHLVRLPWAINQSGR
jgi:hypothetical protein